MNKKTKSTRNMKKLEKYFIGKLTRKPAIYLLKNKNPDVRSGNRGLRNPASNNDSD